MGKTGGDADRRILRRVAAFGVDDSVIGASIVPILALFTPAASVQTRWIAIPAGPVPRHSALLESSPRGGTVGKRALGMRVAFE